MRRSITTRITLVVIGIHAVLLPALYFGLDFVVRSSHTDLFVQHARTFARNLAEEMEVGDVLESRQRIVDVLDLAILNGEGVYAELLDNGRSIRSDLNSSNLHWPDRQDFDFGESGDAIYFIALPVTRPGHAAELRLGFDERPTADQIRLAMRRVLWALAAYLAVAVALAIAFGLQLSRPVVVLTRAARRIASGNYVQSLKLATGVRELHDLGTDLENMREELVGINERLRAEMRERESAEVRRLELERRLQHRHRVETVGTLAGGIAHEINNALLPIMLLAEAALAEQPPSSAARRDLEQILKSARHAKEIVAKVLMFSRETGVVELGPIDLEAAVREAARLFGLLTPASVEVRVQFAGPYPPVRGDPGLAIQLIMNLCTNGYQAMSGRPGTLTVALAVERVGAGESMRVPPGEYVVLSVADTGHGMSAETMERIFEPFFTTREVGRGTGLGLAVVDGIAASFGATILVESQLGRGTTFKVYFPGARAADEAVVTVTREVGHDEKRADHR
jgi:signal transduction histidine kinase